MTVIRLLPFQVLVVSDLKQDLGYRGTSGHRAGRNVWSYCLFLSTALLLVFIRGDLFILIASFFPLVVRYVIGGKMRVVWWNVLLK